MKTDWVYEAKAIRAEYLTDQIESALEAGVKPSPGLQRAVGRLAHASHALWHKIEALRADQRKEGLDS